MTGWLLNTAGPLDDELVDLLLTGTGRDEFREFDFTPQALVALWFEHEAYVRAEGFRRGLPERDPWIVRTCLRTPRPRRTGQT